MDPWRENELAGTWFSLGGTPEHPDPMKLAPKEIKENFPRNIISHEVCTRELNKLFENFSIVKFRNLEKFCFSNRFPFLLLSFSMFFILFRLV